MRYLSGKFRFAARISWCWSMHGPLCFLLMTDRWVETGQLRLYVDQTWRGGHADGHDSGGGRRGGRRRTIGAARWTIAEAGHWRKSGSARVSIWTGDRLLVQTRRARRKLLLMLLQWMLLVKTIRLLSLAAVLLLLSTIPVLGHSTVQRVIVAGRGIAEEGPCTN